MIDPIWTLKQIFGALLVITGILDGYKYVVQGNKIRKNRSAKGMSRMFMNYALLQDWTKLVYSVLIRDIYIFTISVVALGAMYFMWWEIYFWYPYRMRGCINFKRPNIILYTINSWLPNRIRRRL
jgi:hypothetical protein